MVRALHKKTVLEYMNEKIFLHDLFLGEILYLYSFRKHLQLSSHIMMKE